MTGNDNFRDDDLRARFAELRREEESQAPEFACPSAGWAGQGRRWPVGRLIAGAVCLVILVAAISLLRLVPSERTGPFVTSLTEWRSPTDFLLETPGRELLRTVPAIGVWHDYARDSKSGKKHPEVKKQVLP